MKERRREILFKSFIIRHEFAFLSNENIRFISFFRCTMLRLRHEHKLCLKSDNLDFFYEDPPNQLFAYHRYDNDKTDHILVIINWSGKILNNYLIKDIPVQGQWKEWTTENLFNVNDDKILKLNLQGQQGKIFILNKQ
jgi:1,4-alpha-glucan branching enzyme